MLYKHVYTLFLNLTSVQLIEELVVLLVLREVDGTRPLDIRVEREACFDLPHKHLMGDFVIWS